MSNTFCQGRAKNFAGETLPWHAPRWLRACSHPFRGDAAHFLDQIFTISKM